MKEQEKKTHKVHITSKAFSDDSIYNSDLPFKSALPRSTSCLFFPLHSTYTSYSICVLFLSPGCHRQEQRMEKVGRKPDKSNRIPYMYFKNTKISK